MYWVTQRVLDISLRAYKAKWSKPSGSPSIKNILQVNTEQRRMQKTWIFRFQGRFFFRLRKCEFCVPSSIHQLVIVMALFNPPLRLLSFLQFLWLWKTKIPSQLRSMSRVYTHSENHRNYFARLSMASWKEKTLPTLFLAAIKSGDSLCVLVWLAKWPNSTVRTRFILCLMR